MQAQVTVTGGSTTLYGTVSSVGLVAQTSSSGAAVVPVEIAVTGAQTDLYAGTSATASIIVKQVSNVLTVASRAIQTDTSGGSQSTYVMKIVDGKAVKTPVTTGTVYGATTEIKSGLADGDTVQIPGISTSSGGSGSGTRGTGSGFPAGGFSGGDTAGLTGGDFGHGSFTGGGQ
jgi:macrolide-specific efflux system membrane fusion protein